MPVGRHVAAEGVGVDGAVLALEEVGVHRLVGEVEGEGTLPRALDERTGPLVQEIGDVARARRAR